VLHIHVSVIEIMDDRLFRGRASTETKRK
jgi:hypothetical protein